MFVKLLQGHRPNCTALKIVERGGWEHPWFVDSEWADESRDRIGRIHKHGSRINFLRFRCNSPDCPAHGIVSRADIEDEVSRALARKIR